MGFVLAKPIKSLNNFKPILLCDWCAQSAGQRVHGNCERQRLVVHLDCGANPHFDPSDTRGLDLRKSRCVFGVDKVNLGSCSKRVEPVRDCMKKGNSLILLLQACTKS